MTSVQYGKRKTQAIRNEFTVYGFVRDIEKQMATFHSKVVVIPNVIKNIIIEYIVYFAFELNSLNENKFMLNEEDMNIELQAISASVRFGDYISCPDFSQTHSHLYENMKKLRKEYLKSTVIKNNEFFQHKIVRDFNLNDPRFKNVSQLSSLSTLPIFRAAFLIDMNPMMCAIGFATKKFDEWHKINCGYEDVCILFGDGILHSSRKFDGLKQDGYQFKNLVLFKFRSFYSRRDVVICEVDMNARIGRLFNAKGGESFVIGLPENEDICIILYLTRAEGKVTVIDCGNV